MFSRSFLLLTAILLLTGCATQRIPFNEAEYATRPKTGDKVVIGTIFLVDQLEEKQVGDHSEITLEPVTSYSNQWFETCYLGNRTL
ncbi:MAG TPA: hypothetical protein VLA15_04270, partial [Desulfurivibrionaceae bacterium]|nr:hypothetical protein [Desulfurivibrionaceae bacterium]